MNRLQILAEARGTTLYALAKRHNIKRATIYKWAADPGRLSLNQVRLLAKILHMKTVNLVKELEPEIKALERLK